jgi:FMN phosphatase YigB (HAD superfamily)
LLIIFDLDDTLIDTSGCITPFKIELALKSMVTSGLEVGNLDIALETFNRINAEASSGKDALMEFLEIVDAPDGFFSVGMEVIYGPIPTTCKVASFEGVIQLLADLKKKHQLALVSSGNYEQQVYKMKKAGIDSMIFSKIVILEECDKGIYYKQIIESLMFPPSSTLVCGDRVTKDLLPGKDIGCITVQIQKGRGLSLIERRMSGQVDFVIKNIEELKDIIVTILNSSHGVFF